MHFLFGLAFFWLLQLLSRWNWAFHILLGMQLKSTVLQQDTILAHLENTCSQVRLAIYWLALDLLSNASHFVGQVTPNLHHFSQNHLQTYSSSQHHDLTQWILPPALDS